MLRNFLIYILSLLVVATGAVAVYDRSAFPGGPEGSVLDPLPPPFAGSKQLNLVLIGADDRELRGRSDTLMVLQLNPAQRRALLISIPRDLRAYIPGHGEQKINHAYHYGAAKLTRRTVERLLGIDTDGFIKVNLDGFVKAVDILGGVDLNVEDLEGQGRGMNYDCPQDGLVIHLKPGYQHLTGYKAMGYVRYRKSNIPGQGGTDFQRAERQQKFIKAMIAQKLRVTKLPALYKAAREVYRCVKTTLSWRQMLDLVRFMRDLTPAQLKSVTLPGDDQMIGGTYYCVLDEGAYQKLMAEAEAFLRGSAPEESEPEFVTGPCRVQVLNGSGVSGAASRVADKLKREGFEIVSVGNAPRADQKQTLVMYRGKVRAEAQRVADVLGGGMLREDVGAGDAPPGSAQVQVTLGRDLAKSQADHG
jgi:LCP family protein required for cell wall assembly